MTGEQLPNGFDRAAWLSAVADRIAELEAELGTTEDKSRRLAIDHELHERRFQLEARRRYLLEVEQ